MIIVRRRYGNWDERTKRRLRHATLEDGFLRLYMVAFPESPTIVVFGPHEIMGWAFVLPRGHLGCPNVNLYVNQRYRRRGIASLLIAEALKDHEHLSLAKWDKTTKRLFERMSNENPGRITVFSWWKVVHLYRRMVRDAYLTKGYAVCELQ